jgi:hypothetical protein
MIVVRETFVAKPGQASKLAGLFKSIIDAGLMGGARVLTDMTGEFNRVVLETEAASLAELEARMQDYAKNQAIKEKMKGYAELYQTGSREVYQVWG